MTQHAAQPRYSFHSAIIFPIYSILSAYRACRDARRRVETGCFPRVERGVWGASPPHSACTRNRFFAYQPQATRRREPPPMPFAYSAAKPRYCFHSTIIFATYSILPIYRACRDARRRVETGVSPTPKGGCGGHPPHIRAYTRNRFFAYQPQATRRREPSPMPFAYSAA